MSPDRPTNPITTADAPYVSSILSETSPFCWRRPRASVASTESSFAVAGGPSASLLCRLSASRIVLTDSFRLDESAAHATPQPLADRWTALRPSAWPHRLAP